MNNLSDLMRERLEKWRKNPQRISSSKVRDSQGVYIPRKESGDEYEEEALLLDQRNRCNNGQRNSR